jgi:hypothetical protein
MEDAADLRPARNRRGEGGIEQEGPVLVDRQQQGDILARRQRDARNLRAQRGDARLGFAHRQQDVGGGEAACVGALHEAVEELPRGRRQLRPRFRRRLELFHPGHVPSRMFIGASRHADAPLL